MTLPGSNDRLQRTMPRPSNIPLTYHSIPDTLFTPAPTTTTTTSSSQAMSPASSFSSTSASISLPEVDHEHALNVATNSWDLATGGFKTLTAKRELPIRPERRSSSVMPAILATSRSYIFALVMMVCVVLMLIGGGIVLFVMLQP